MNEHPARNKGAEGRVGLSVDATLLALEALREICDIATPTPATSRLRN